MNFKDLRDLILSLLIILPMCIALLAGTLYKRYIEYISIYLLISILFLIIWSTIKITEAIAKINKKE